MITYYRRTIKEEKITVLDKFEVGAWISVINPSDEEIEFLYTNFKLDRRNLLSGIDENEVPRLDIIEEDICIFTRIVLSPMQLETFLMVIGEDFILTLAKEEPGFFKDILEREIDFFTTQRIKSLIKFLFHINNGFEKEIIDIVKEVRASSARRQGLSEKDIESLLEKENHLNLLSSTYQNMILVYERFLKRIPVYEQDREIIADLIEEMNQGFDLCKSSLVTISNIRNYYALILSNRLNRMITVLTILTVLISLPAAISGIYGMNIHLPLQRSPYAFWYILGIIVLSWVILYVYLKERISR